MTCSFNDVHNSRVEVRPDRAYLKQQLKAVEARVLAIQEKKRKLDQRMSVLTDGLKVRLGVLVLVWVSVAWVFVICGGLMGGAARKGACWRCSSTCIAGAASD